MAKLILMFIFAVGAWISVTAILAINPDILGLNDQVLNTWLAFSKPVGEFFAPIVKIVFLVFIALEVLKWFGVGGKKQRSDVENEANQSPPKALEISFNGLIRSEAVQALLAVVIVGSFSISVLAGISGSSALKDVALVVVGFYFGTRVKKGEEDVIWLGQQRPTSYDDASEQTKQEEVESAKST